MTQLSAASNIYLNIFEKELLQNAHASYQSILVEKEFGGGYSDTRVFLIQPVRANGVRDARVVSKIGLATDLQREKNNYDDFAGPALPFTAAQIKSIYFKEDDRAVITYVFTGGEALGETISLEDYYHTRQAEDINKTLDVLLDQTLGAAWYGQSQPYHCLFQAEYGRHLLPYEELRKIVSTIHPHLSAVDEKHIQIPGVSTIYPDPLALYPKLLDQTLSGRRSLVHGDLHIRNVLVDATGKGWLIDFAKVNERHNLFDFIKLETYIRLMALAEVAGAFSLTEYAQFEQALNNITLGQASTPPVNPELLKAWQVIQNIRQIARKYMGPKPDFNKEYFPALFLYALSMLKYFSVNGPAATQLMYMTTCILGKFMVEPNTTASVKLDTDSQKSDTVASSEEETQVTILLQGDHEKSRLAKQSSFLVALSRILNIEPEKISIFRVSPASMGVTLKMPQKSALKLMDMWFSKNLELIQLNILKIAFQQEKDTSEVNKMQKNKNPGQGGITINGNATGNVIISGDHNKVDQRTQNIKTDGGAYINGNVNGGVVGRDNINVDNSTHITNNTGTSIDAIAKAFALIEAQARQEKDTTKKEDSLQAIEGLKAEAARGEQAEEKRVQRWFNFLADASIDVWEVAVASLSDPILGLGTAFKKIAQYAKEERDKRSRS